MGAQRIWERVFVGLIFALCFSICATSGAFIHVSPNGVDTASGLTSTDPVRTISQAVNIALAGDIILLSNISAHNFDTQQQITKSITIQPELPNNNVIITSSILTTSSLFSVSAPSSNVTIRDITFALDTRNLPNFVILLSSNTNIQLLNINIRCMRSRDSCVPLEITGGSLDASNVTIDGGGTSSITSLAASSQFRNSFFLFANGSNNGPFQLNGVSNELIFDNCVISHSSSAGIAGIRLVSSSRVVFRHSACIHSQAQAGACFSLFTSSSILVQNSTFQDNHAREPTSTTGATFGGGAIRLGGPSSAEIYYSYFARNHATSRGGAVYASGTASMRIWDSVFEECSAVDGGAALLGSLGIVSVYRSHFRRNRMIGGTTVGYGTVAWFAPSTHTVVETTFSGCTFDSNYVENIFATPGGALCLFFRTILVENNLFVNNSALYGGGLLILEGLSPMIRNNTFLHNTALRGGALEIEWLQAPNPTYALATIADNTFISNSVTGPANAISISAGALGVIGGTEVVISGNKFFNNSAHRHVLGPAVSGGAVDIISLFNSVFTVSNNVFRGNHIISTVGTLAAGSAFRVVGENAGVSQIDVNDCLFEDNYIISVVTTAAQGGALVAQLIAAPSMKLNVRHSAFRGNIGQFGGAIFTTLVNFLIEDTLFENNFGEVYVGAVTVVKRPSPSGLTEGFFANCTFINNTALEGQAQSIMVDVVVTGIACENTTETQLRVGFDSLTTFSRLQDVSPTFFYGNLIADGCSEVYFTQRDQHPIVAPVTWGVGSAIINATLAETRFSCMRLWRGVQNVRPTQLLIGDHDAIFLSNKRTHFWDDGVIQSFGRGRILVEGTALPINPTTKFLRNVDFILVDSGSLEIYPTTMELDNSSIIVERNASLFFPVFKPPAVVQRSNHSSTISSIIIRGQMDQVSVDMKGINLTVEAGGVVTHSIHNSAVPAWIEFDAQSSLNFNGSLRVNFSSSLQRRLPDFQQEFTMSRNIPFPIAPSGVEYFHGYLGDYFIRGKDSLFRVTSMTPLSMSLNDAGTFITVVFPEPTNTPTSRKCVGILNASTISQLSSSPECAWASPTELIIQTTLVPSHISLQQGAVHSYRDSRLVAVIPSSYRVKLPSNTVAPTVVLSAPLISPTCSDLSLDGSASYNLGHANSAQYRWSLQTSTATSTASLVSFLDALSLASSRIDIPSVLFESNMNYTFTLNVTNSFGRSSVANTQIFRAPAASLSVFIEGPQQRETPTAFAVQIHGRVHVPCNSGSVTSVTRQWRQIGGPFLDLDPSSLSDFLLDIPRLTMRPRTNYTLEFSAWPTGNPLLVASAQVQLQAIASPVSIQVSGSSGLVSSLQSITITGDLVDPDAGSFSAADYEWRWEAQACPGKSNEGRISSLDIAEAYLRASSVIKGLNNDSTSETSVLRLPESGSYCLNSTNQLVLFQPPILSGLSTSITLNSGTFADGEVLLGLTVLNKVDGRVHNRLIFLNFTSQVDPSSLVQLNIDIPTRRDANILSQEKLILRSSVAANSTNQLLWEDFPAGTLLSAQNLLTSLTGTNVVVRSGVASPGQFYSVALLQSSASKRGAAREFFLVNSAPASGSVRLEPAGVVARQFSRFRVAAPGWVDEELPLKYLFSIVSQRFGSVVQEIFLTELVDVPVAEVLSAVSGEVTLRVRVFDRQGALSIGETSINIEAASGVAASALVSEFGNYARWGDLRSATQVAVTLLYAKIAANETLDQRARDRVLEELTALVSRRPVAWINSPGVVNVLQLVTRSGALSQQALENCTLILERVVAAAQTSTGTALSFSSSELARFSVVGFLQSSVSVARLVLASPEISTALRARLQRVVEAFIIFQSRFVVADELANQIVTEALNATTAIVSSDSITSNAGVVVISGVSINLTQWNGSVGISVINWDGNAFPFDGNNLNPVIQVLLQNAAAATVVVDVKSARNGTCATFNEQSSTWDTTKCISILLLNGAVRCECLVESFGSSGRVSLSLLFTATSSTTDPTGAPPSLDSASPSNVGAIVGGVIAGIVLVGVIVAILLFVFVPSIRSKISPFSNNQGHHGSLHEQAEELEETSNPATPTTSWAPARTPTSV